jgi:hypothetical protein
VIIALKVGCMNEYVTCKEVAAQVRKDLKEKYPTVKFSVTSKHNSVSVGYVDGPIVADVEAMVEAYCGRRDYDHNYCDYGRNVEVMFQGVMRKTNLIYVSVSRNFSLDFLQSVVDYVKSEYANAEDEDVKIEVGMSGNVYLDWADYDQSQKYRDIYNRCHAFAPVAEQEAALRKKKDEEMEIWLAQKAIDDMLYKIQEEEEQEEIATIIPTSIKEFTPDEKFFCNGVFSNMNKLSTLDEYIDECKKGNCNLQPCLVEGVVTMSAAVYDTYCQYLMHDFPWFAGKGGSGSTAKLREVAEWCDYTEEERYLWRSHSYDKCILVIVEGDDSRTPLLIDPQGYNYARYVGLGNAKEILPLLNKRASNVIPFPVSVK